MKSILLQIIFAFKRDAVFLSTTMLTILCTCFALFLGSNAVVEANEARIVYTAGFSRIATILGFITFIVFYIKRMFDNHEIEVILSHSISRPKMLISMFGGFSLVLLVLIFPLIIIFLLLKIKFINLFIWCLSVYFEGIIVLSFTLCCSLILKSFTHCLSASFVMYLVGRIIGNFVAYLTLSTSLEWRSICGSLLKLLSLFLPRLDLFGKTSWLIYGDYTLNNICIFTLQTFIFCGVFITIACLDMRKKEF